MQRNFFHELLAERIADGSDPMEYWQPDRTPLDSIDKPVTHLLDLRGKKAVVTGGAGRNLGQACVNRLAGLGADVAVLDLTPAAAQGRQRWETPPDAEGVAAAAAEKWGGRTVAVYGDVTDWDDVLRSIAECHDKLGGLDILVNSAPQAVVKEFVDMSREDIDRTISGTLVGPMYCTKAALTYLVPQGSGRIINVGSGSSLAASPAFTVYGAAKAGLNSFTNFLAHEVAKHGIHVLGVHAGMMWGPDRPAPPADTVQTLIPRMRTALQRYTLPEEVANMVAFLASDAASCMTGTMVDMTGGRA